ncbi:MAG: Crp/Fnr family transcriptional regulator [Balneolaceae bacterium]
MNLKSLSEFGKAFFVDLDMQFYTSLQQFLSSFHTVTEHVMEEYLSHWSEYQLPKKTIMTAPGETERYWYFVVEGIQKSYYLHDDKQHVIAFTYAPSLTGIPESVITQTPSKYYLETITDSLFLRIPYSKHLEMMEKHREIETLFRKATEVFLIGMLERYYQLMAYDIESRFKAFMKRSPHLLDMVAQKDLASYLRIDATNFSKLMNSVRL